MPTYQYACTECNHEFEQFQSFSDEALTSCPSCSGKLRKVYGSVGVVFKGSGFYRTDSRSGSSDSTSLPAKAEGSKESGSKDSASTSTKESAKTPAAASTSSTPSTSSPAKAPAAAAAS